MDPVENALIQVLVSHSSGPRTVEQVALTLPGGSCVVDALKASGLADRHGWVLDDSLQVGVWMKLQALTTPLRDQDRVEIYRGLKVDPKEARRQRYRKQQPPKKT